jgi:phage pi2 protein 07
MKQKKDFYLESSLDQIPRLLCLLDREFLSPTCGSFDRPYWHHRTKDFPSAALQQGILSLALIWKNEFSNNPYYKSEYIYELILKAFYFTQKIQKRDGSFDEWYWNERGWAGPTGYIVHAVSSTYFIIEDQLTLEQKNDFKEFIKKSSFFLIESWEKDVLANHIAMSILAVAESYKILSEPQLKAGLDNLIERFEDYFYINEGWSLEYDGADIGYQTGTLSFLSRALAIYENESLRNYCSKSLEFISYFCAPDGSLVSHVGSRQTSNVFHYGFEFFSESKLAKRLADFFYEGLKTKKLVTAADQEDHYLIYRIPEFLESYLVFQRSQNNEISLLPYEQEVFVKKFEKAGIIIRNADSYYVIFAPKRGGVFQMFDKIQKKCLIADVGIAVKLKNKSIWSSLWIDPENQIEYEDHQWSVETRLKKINYPIFTPFKMSVFRLISAVFGFNEHLAYHFKSIIRKLLMTNLKRSKIIFKRKIRFEMDKVYVEDELLLGPKLMQVLSIEKGGIFFTRAIPQTKYFYKDELNFMAKEIKPQKFNFINGTYINKVEF